ncbi:cysteine hydrolase family protein [Dactylosporangium sp. McL0621]|uniref:cysteine hydrolase family protein n=1 Tax=Dactylosporangium sp. McL0621 TaxID=3415678 RepID=UPI003CEE9B7A
MTATDPWTRPEWDRAALLTIDTQVDFIEGGASPVPGTAAVVPVVGALAAAFRRAGRPIVHVIRLYQGQDVDLARRTLLDGGAPIVRPGSPGSQIAPALLPPGAPELDAPKLLAGEFQPLGPGEWAMWKPRWGAFHRTGLEAFLREQGVSTVVVAGCNFPNCPRAAIIGASERDFRVVAAADAISGVDERHLAEAARLGAGSAPAGAIAESLR